MALSPTICPSCNTLNRAGSAFCNKCGSSLTGGSPSGPTRRLASGQVLKQRYRILQIVGQGGMGAVYKAEDTQLGNRLVAMKEMSQSGLSQQEVKEAADAFKQEAMILARLQHPNLPNIFDHFEENGRWYLAMSFIQGETLEDYLSKTKEGKIPLDEALKIGIQLSTVLDYLHNQQPSIIFRDLKPANIMRTPSGDIYLIDFGIARHFKPGQARDTAYFGSMGYAPPEQFGKAQTTPRSDIYNLGATVYQLVSGHEPASTPFRFPPLQSIEPSAPSNLATLLKQMLEQDEDKRPADMLFVKRELEQIADQRLHPPVPPTTPVPPTVPAPPSTSVPPTERVPVIIRAPQKKGVTRRNVIIGLIVVVVLGVIGTVASHSSPPPPPPSVTLSNYCNALKTGDYQSAYNELSSGNQSKYTESQFASDHSNVTDCTVSNVNDTAGTGTISYTGSNGAQVVADYTLVNENGWKINTETLR